MGSAHLHHHTRDIASLAPSRKSLPAGKHGFTLIEMLVVVAIISILSAIVYVGQSNFTNSYSVTNAAYDIALSVRDAEIYGIGSSGSSGSFHEGYGLYFTTAAPTSYILFADTSPSRFTGPSGLCHPYNSITGPNAPDAKDGDCLYDYGSNTTDQLLTTYTLNNGMKISKFCATDGTTHYCTGLTPHSISALDIVFTRPNTNAVISGITVPSGTVVPSIGTGSLLSACLTVQSPQGKQRSLQITEFGEVSPATSCS